MCQTVGDRPALFYLILLRSLHAGINYHYPQFASKEKEAQMEVQYYLPRATKLGKAALGFDSLACCDKKACHFKAPSMVHKEKTILKRNK